MRKKSKNQTMGCCGCSLAASALTAVFLGLIESLVGMAWNILVIVLIEMQKKSNDFDGSENFTTVDEFTESTTTIIEEIPNNDSIFLNHTDWDIFKDTITASKAREQAHIFELSVTALVLNSFWLITTLALAIGNAEKCRDMLKPWIVTTVVITISDIAATVYFIFKAYKDTEGNLNNIDRLFVENVFVVLATFFSRGGPIVWMANVALCIFVAQRIKEIEVLKKRLPFDTDSRPYITSHSPFDAYGPDYRFEKNLRPHTPPPDYEARYGAREKPQRRKPPPSECETVPVSLRSGSSVAPRPSSRIYEPDADDRVELQHRASEHHPHHHHHAYDNKGLETEPSDVWLGIPRPTLKVNR